MSMTITEKDLDIFEKSLYYNEKSASTIKKYVLAVRRLGEFLGERELSKKLLFQYREVLLDRLKPQTVNGVLSAINVWLGLIGKENLKVKLLKVQRQLFLSERKELTTEEYKKLLKTAKEAGNERLYLLMLTLGATGIRVSELKCITVENLKRRRADICLKGKCRTVLLQKKLCRRLLSYAGRKGIFGGIVFRTRTGGAMDRSNICHEMKRLSRMAGVAPEKVFPHNFRHLFARAFYAVEKNISHLADVLGHSSIETTRIYVAASAAFHERTLEKMRLIL